MEKNIKPRTALFGSLHEKANSFIKRCVDHGNKTFNAFSLRTKRTSVILFGITIAAICAMLIVNAMNGTSPDSLSIDKITVPNDIYMNDADTQTLIPIGKMKGEVDGEFDAFYVAADANGQLYINRDLDYAENAYDKSKGWEPITRQQLETYEKALHFIPHQKRGLKR